MSSATSRDGNLKLLLDNDFHVLGLSVRDPGTKVLEAASDPLLAVGADRAERARIALTNPRARIAAEVGWLPGVSPARARQLIAELLNGSSQKKPEGLPPTAYANFLLSAIASSESTSPQEALPVIREALAAILAIDPSGLLRDINEDRAVAGVPQVRGEELIAQALRGQRDNYVRALRLYLDGLTTDTMVACATSLAEVETSCGTVPASEVLSDLLDTYEIEAITFLKPEADRIRKLAGAILEHGAAGEAHVTPAISRLIDLLAAWDRVAQPLQVYKKSQGESHALSSSLARDLREIAVALVNDHDLIGPASQIHEALRRAFGELPDLRDLFEDDSINLERLSQDALQQESAEAELSYAATIGLSRTRLSINSREIVFGTQRFATGEINRIRWGGTAHSVNGIPTGTTHTIAFGTAERQCVVDTRSKDVFAAFTERLWRVCGVPIAVRTLNRLRQGEKLSVGGVQFTDTSVTLVRSRVFKKPEIEIISWEDVSVWSENGYFVIASRKDKNFRASASFQLDNNTHVLANLVQGAFDRGLTRLSDLLT